MTFCQVVLENPTRGQTMPQLCRRDRPVLRRVEVGSGCQEQTSVPDMLTEGELAGLSDGAASRC